MLPQRKNPTSQHEQRGLDIQLVATLLLGQLMVYLDIDPVSVSDFINCGQQLNCRRQNKCGTGI